MPTRKMIVLSSILFASNAMADRTEYCPSVLTIFNNNGVYTAPTVSGKGQWLGVAHGGKANVTKFTSGLFYPDEKTADSIGTLAKCTYQTGEGVAVDLRYRSDVTPDIRVRLKHTANWEEKTGPFGTVYFECSEQANATCAFTEA